MVDGIFEALEDWLRETLVGGVQNCLKNAGTTMGDMIDVMNENITDTPQTWNNTLFRTLETISQTAIVPIAVALMAIILCYDLITATIDKNNMKDTDISIFFRFGIKAWVATYFINNVFTIVGAIFELGADIADKALTSLFGENQKFNDVLSSQEFTEMLSECELIDLFGALILSFSAYVITLVVMLIILIVTAGRMIEILVYFCGAPIPFATFANKEWNNVGFSFIKNMFALALQAFFIVIIVAIYIILFNANVLEPTDLAGLTGSLIEWICYSVICCFMLLKTGSIAKSICNAH